MKGVLDDEDRQSSDATKLYYNFGFASISITDPREHSDKGISQLFKCFALADGRVTATPPPRFHPGGSWQRRLLPPAAATPKGAEIVQDKGRPLTYRAFHQRPLPRVRFPAHAMLPPVRCQDHHRARRSFRRPIVLAWQAAAADQADFVKTSDGSP